MMVRCQSSPRSEAGIPAPHHRHDGNAAGSEPLHGDRRSWPVRRRRTNRDRPHA